MQEVQVSAAATENEREAEREKMFIWEIVRVDVWKTCNRKDDERENPDSLILQLSDSLLFIVL